MLRRKMLRDIKENKIAYLACIFVLAVGLISYISMTVARDNLLLARTDFYSEFNFADGFAKVRSMPINRVGDFEKITGVKRAEGRLSKEVRVLVDRKDRNVGLKLLSLDIGKVGRLNDVMVLSGTFPQSGKNEILVADKFFKANGFNKSDEVSILVEGKKVNLTISGSGQSPEFIYVMRSGQDVVPDPLNYEVAYVDYGYMARLFNSSGVVNDISFTLEDGYNFKDIEERVKEFLEPYSLESLVARKDQISDTMLSEELKQLQKSSQSIPLVFIGVSSIIIYIMMKRLVESQRTQIGVLKAFGYRKFEVLRHYIYYGIFIGFLGGALGGLLGIWLSVFFTRMYQTYYSLPNLEGRFSLGYLVAGISVSLLFCSFAAWQGSKGVLKLQPAESLHPQIPIFKKKSIIEKIPGFLTIFNVQGRMAIRNIVRNRTRSIFTFVGIVGAFCLMAVLFSQNKIIDLMVIDQFTSVQKYDMKIAFNKPLPAKDTTKELEKKRGVTIVEPVLEVPVTIKHLNLKKDIIMIGLKKESSLYQLKDKKGHKVTIPQNGVAIAEVTANSLGVSKGDRLRIESIWAKDSPFYVTIEEVIPQYIGTNVYMDIDKLNQKLRQGQMATSLFLKTDLDAIKTIKEDYLNSGDIGLIEIRQQTIDKYKKLMGSFAYTMLIMAFISVFTGFAIVYNSSIISFEERKREIASLRVLGMTKSEVMEVVSIEQILIGVSGILVGIPGSYWLNTMIARGLSSDLFSIPVVFEPSALVQASLGTLFAIFVAMIWIRKRISRLDLVEVLKERD